MNTPLSMAKVSAHKGVGVGVDVNLFVSDSDTYITNPNKDEFLKNVSYHYKIIEY